MPFWQYGRGSTNNCRNTSIDPNKYQIKTYVDNALVKARAQSIFLEFYLHANVLFQHCVTSGRIAYVSRPIVQMTQGRGETGHPTPIHSRDTVAVGASIKLAATTFQERICVNETAVTGCTRQGITGSETTKRPTVCIRPRDEREGSATRLTSS